MTDQAIPLIVADDGERRLLRALWRLWLSISASTLDATDPRRIGLHTRSSWELLGYAEQLERMP